MMKRARDVMSGVGVGVKGDGLVLGGTGVRRGRSEEV